jgi:hypothetical protein
MAVIYFLHSFLVKMEWKETFLVAYQGVLELGASSQLARTTPILYLLAIDDYTQFNKKRNE